MFAIAFDLITANVAVHHPKSISAAYTDIGRAVGKYDFEWVQGSVYVNKGDNLADLTSAMAALKAIPWLPLSVRDIRGFKVESWSDFTPFMKAEF